MAKVCIVFSMRVWFTLWSYFEHHAILESHKFVQVIPDPQACQDTAVSRNATELGLLTTMSHPSIVQVCSQNGFKCFVAANTT